MACRGRVPGVRRIHAQVNSRGIPGSGSLGLPIADAIGLNA